MLGPLAVSPLRSLTALAHADKIQAVIFNLETHRAHRALNADCELLVDRHLRILYLSADATDEVVVRVLRNLEMAETTAEIEFAHAALRNQDAQIAIDRAEAQARKLPFDERINALSGQMTAVVLDSLKHGLPLFGAAILHGILLDGQHPTGLEVGCQAYQ